MRLVAALVALMLLDCGGRTAADHDAIGKYDGDGDAGLDALIEEDRRAFCQKDIECGMAVSVDVCIAARVSVPLRCTMDAAAIRDCLDVLAVQDCQEYAVTSGRSCVPLHKWVGIFHGAEPV